ncbi:MAG: EamA family transporter [Woeseiaceae bacterium]|nr:EamA family transporter [Woeseiaceae bacterium]
MSNGALYLISVLIWGSTWLAIEFQLGVVAPEVSIVYRYVIAAAMMFAWCHIRGTSLRFGLRDHLRFVLFGLLQFCLNYILAYRAQIYITSALAAITFASMVWMNIAFARLFFGARAGWPVLVGAVLGMAGIVVVFGPQVTDLSLSDAALLGCTLAFLGALSASLGNMVSQRAQLDGIPVAPANAWGMLYSVGWTSIAVLASGHPITFDWSAGYVLSLLYLAIFGSVVAFWSYLTLVGRIGAHRAGYTSVMFPVVALLLSILFEDLDVSLTVVAGFALVLLGNVFVLRTRPVADN